MSDKSANTALLGLDIGTTRCKLNCYAGDGTIIAAASAGYAITEPHPAWAEIEPRDILDAVRATCGEVARHLDRFDRLAMAISAQGEAFVLVDAEGRPLAPVPISIDMRGIEAIEEMRADPAVQRASHAAGQELNALSSLAKLLWYRKEAGDILAQTDQALGVGEFVLRHLGLRPVMDHSIAARTGLLDVRSKSWSRELIEIVGLTADLLPPVARSGDFVGTASREQMATLGLSRQVDIYTGGHDQACAMLGAGVIDGSTALYSVGTTEAIGIPSAECPGDLGDLHITPYPHVVDGEYVLLFGSQHGGRVLPWLSGILGRDATAIVPQDPLPGPSKLTLVSHLAGSGSVFADEAAKAILYGLDYETTPEMLTIAALEGITLEQAVGLNRLAARGISPSVLRAVGGGSRSDVWMQLKADITGVPMECLDEPDAACAGAAILAGTGTGLFHSAADASERLVSIRHRFVPRPSLRDVYDLKRALYEKTYQAAADLRPLQAKLERAIA